MTLQAEDGEGEQNELRIFQAQLDSSTTLIKNLSKQLSELKEQVPFNYLFTFFHKYVVLL